MQMSNSNSSIWHYPSLASRIVIIGGGAGGLEFATRLGRAHLFAKVTLIDRNATHLWKPRLHEVAVGLTGADGETSYLAQAHRSGFDFVIGELISFDPDYQTVRIAPLMNTETGETILPEREIPFDVLVLALGSRVNDFGIPGVLDHCHMLDNAGQALHLQRKVLEGAVQVVAGRMDRLRVGIVGAGATGVELAAELHHAVRSMEQYGGLGAGDRLDITVIDQASRVLPATDPRTSDRAQTVLEQLGVSVLLGKSVERVCEDAIHLSGGEAIPCDIKIWASGVVGQHVVEALPELTLAKNKRILVDDTLACLGHSNIFAMGDCAAAPVASGTAPPTAQVAHQQAAYLAGAFINGAKGRSIRPFRYHPLGTLISLGAHDAEGEFASRRHNRPVVHASGTIAKLMYTSLYHAHRATLYGPLRAGALYLSDMLKGAAVPPIKLH
jgi:NADH dehydrogenase